jgi:hypothetical protein
MLKRDMMVPIQNRRAFAHQLLQTCCPTRWSKCSKLARTLVKSNFAGASAVQALGWKPLTDCSGFVAALAACELKTTATTATATAAIFQLYLII